MLSSTVMNEGRTVDAKEFSRCEAGREILWGT